jgi:hypothetical protein
MKHFPVENYNPLDIRIRIAGNLKTLQIGNQQGRYSKPEPLRERQRPPQLHWKYRLI